MSVAFSYSGVWEESNKFSYKTWTPKNHLPHLRHPYGPRLSQSLDSQQKNKPAAMDGTEIDYFAQIRSYLLILDRIIRVDKPKQQDHRGWGWAERPRHGHNPPQPITPPAIILPFCKPRAKPQSPTFPCKLLVLSFKIQRPFSPFQWPPCPFFRSSWAVKLWELTFAFWVSLKKRKNIHFVPISPVILHTTVQRMVHKVLRGKSVPPFFLNLSLPLQWSQNHIPPPFWDGYSGWSAPNGPMLNLFYLLIHVIAAFVKMRSSVIKLL